MVWFYGLLGSGKSTIARGVFEKITSGKKKDVNQRPKVALVEMDSIRKKIFPEANYSDEERDAAYRSLVLIGSFLSFSGVSAFLDGTGHRRIWREFARKECPNFVEVYVKCPIEICIERETARASDEVRHKLYRDAQERLKTGMRIEGLGKVPGIDVPFEESPSPEIIIDSSKGTPQELVDQALKALFKYDPKLFYIGKQN